MCSEVAQKNRPRDNFCVTSRNTHRRAAAETSPPGQLVGVDDKIRKDTNGYERGRSIPKYTHGKNVPDTYIPNPHPQIASGRLRSLRVVSGRIARVISGHLGSGRLGPSRVASGRLGSSRVVSGRLGSSRGVSGRLGSSRVVSGRLGSSRVVSGRNSQVVSGRLGSSRVT